MTEQMTGMEIEYNDTEKIGAALIGRKIVSRKEGTVGSFGKLPGYGHGDDAVEFTLDDGSRFYAIDADGGCACSNGCFYVKPGEVPENVITSVEVVEEPDGYESATIRLFVYSEGKKTELFNSEGGDNGYYGWGHHIAVIPA